jgi:hypothetical protein
MKNDDKKLQRVLGDMNGVLGLPTDLHSHPRERKEVELQQT